MPKQCCRNCHFLAQRSLKMGAPIRAEKKSWSAQERSSSQRKAHLSPLCFQGIWDVEIGPINIEDELRKPRGDTCFFIEAQEGMSFEAAQALHKIRSETRNLKKTLYITQIGLLISALGVFLNLGYSIFRDFWITP